jgi:hypothetical protein
MVRPTYSRSERSNGLFERSEKSWCACMRPQSTIGIGAAPPPHASAPPRATGADSRFRHCGTSCRGGQQGSAFWARRRGLRGFVSLRVWRLGRVCGVCLCSRTRIGTEARSEGILSSELQQLRLANRLRSTNQPQPSRLRFARQARCGGNCHRNACIRMSLRSERNASAAAQGDPNAATARRH